MNLTPSQQRAVFAQRLEEQLGAGLSPLRALRRTFANAGASLRDHPFYLDQVAATALRNAARACADAEAALVDLFHAVGPEAPRVVGAPELEEPRA